MDEEGQRNMEIVAVTGFEPQPSQEEAEGACQWARQNLFPSVRHLVTHVQALLSNFGFWS